MEKVRNSSAISLEWKPLVKVGPFIFGDTIDSYIAKYRLNHVPEEYNERVGWEVYRLDEDVSVFTEKGRIVAVSSCRECIYKGINIIDISVDKVLCIIGIQPDMVESEKLIDDTQVVYDFDKIGLQLWVRKGDVVRAILDGPS